MKNIKGEIMFDKKEWQKNYNQERKEYYIKYHQENKEHFNKYSKQYQLEHSEQIRQHKKQYYIENLEQIRQNHEQYYIENKRQFMKAAIKWQINNPKKVKEISIRHKNKRIRNLEFEPLNESFKNSEAHHINRINIVYIPKIIHRSIRHCLETGRNMEKINKLAMDFILKGA